MKFRALVLFASLFLFSCDFVSDIKETSSQQAQLQTTIKQDYGWDVQVGWNIHNGVLTNVTILVDIESVGNEKVAKMEELLKESLSKVFKEEPEILIIQLISTFEK